ncbi:hypothetical protein BCR44DRAFT_1513183 [Catenaria anguillulae PL171]|uniref:C2HC/C3H-type domain-containing protein n=1 Tax=Catenaria anguillulae PL171 TaxID=765915 RepID=A0A1Y2HLA4_9FUNG|nr:hypothetical protein BCR44DRAFT_1513183 [Catenaria anguillulae PL171]
MTSTNVLPYQPTSSPPALPGSSSPTDRIHGTGKLRSFFESVRQDDVSLSSQPKPGNHGHRSAAHHRNTGFGSGPPSSHVGPGPPPPNLHLEYERMMGKKPMSPRTLHAAEAAALALDPAARMALNQQQQQRVHTVPSRSSLVKSQFGSSIPNLQSIYPATRSSILASGPGLAGPTSAKGKGTRSRSGSNNSSMGGSSRRRSGSGTGGGKQQQARHGRHASTDSMAYQQPMLPYPPQPQYPGQQQHQAPIWMSNSPPPLAPSVVNKIHSAHQSRSNSLNRQPAQSAGAPPLQGGYMYPSSAPPNQDWQLQQQQQAFYAQQQQQHYVLQQQMMYQPSPPPQASAPLQQSHSTKKSAPTKTKPSKSSPPIPQQQQQPAPPQPTAPQTKRRKASPPPAAQVPPPPPPPQNEPASSKPARGPPPEGFVACTHCGRSFAPDRVAKHETICLKTANSKRAPVDMSQVRKELIARDNVGAGGR